MSSHDHQTRSSSPRTAGRRQRAVRGLAPAFAALLAFALSFAGPGVSSTSAPVLLGAACLATLLFLSLSAWRRHARAQRSLDASRSAWRDFQQLAGLGSLRYRLGDGSWRVSATFMALTGLPASTGVGFRVLLRLLDRPDQARFLHAVRAAYIDGDTADCDMVRIQRPDGDVRWVHLRARIDSQGKGLKVLLCTIQDISRRTQAPGATGDPDQRDALTGLPGGSRLAQQLGALHPQARERTALLAVDIDHFSRLNLTQGSDRGNILLRAVAGRIEHRVGSAGLVMRLRADRFAVLLTDLSWSAGAAHEAVARLAEMLRAALADPYELEGNSFACTASLGASLSGPEAPSAQELLRRAENALEQAKAGGRDLVRFYDPAMEAVEAARSALESELRKAVSSGQFELHYQAQADSEGRILGAEALVRWRNPVRGLVPPASFIPLCEATGLILPLGRWVLETACARLAAWSVDPALSALTLSVNVSACQFSEPGFVEQVMSALRRNGTDPRRLKLELTEGLLLANTDNVIATIHALKDAGVGISLDDFGTGYSSLAYLKRLPIDQLKIDRTFVADVLHDASDLAIVRTMVALGQSFGIEVVAEGVETEAQRILLIQTGCRVFQGYLLSRPLPLADFERFARERAKRSQQKFDSPEEHALSYVQGEFLHDDSN